MTHTPGPWKVIGGTVIITLDDDGAMKQSIANTPERDGELFWETRHNAHLIAAAPELLEACEAAIAYLDKLDTPLCFCGDDPNCPECRTTDKLEKAISKAKGNDK